MLDNLNFEFWTILKVLGITIALSPIWFALLLEIWDGMIRPSLLGKLLIKEEAYKLIAEYGDRAAEIAFINEDRAWRYCNSFERGKWRRIRKLIEEL